MSFVLSNDSSHCIFFLRGMDLVYKNQLCVSDQFSATFIGKNFSNFSFQHEFPPGGRPPDNLQSRRRQLATFKLLKDSKYLATHLGGWPLIFLEFSRRTKTYLELWIFDIPFWNQPNTTIFVKLIDYYFAYCYVDKNHWKSTEVFFSCFVRPPTTVLIRLQTQICIKVCIIWA